MDFFPAVSQDGRGCDLKFESDNRPVAPVSCDPFHHCAQANRRYM
jgi:hypothetical protein